MTESPHGPLALADGFPPKTHDDWAELARTVVNKSRPEGRKLTAEQAEDALRTHLPGDLTVDPLYSRPAQPQALGYPGAMPFTRGRGARDPGQPWDVRALHEHPDVPTTVAAIADDLQHGVTSLWLRVGADGIAAADVPAVLADVPLGRVPVTVSSADDQAAAADALGALLAPVDGPAAGNLGHDPIGYAARRGGTPDTGPLVAAVRTCLTSLPPVRAVTVDSTVYHDAGASAVDEMCARRGDRRRLPAGPRGRRDRARRRGGADRLPDGRQRRPVPHHRLGAGHPATVGPGRRGKRCPRGGPGRPRPRRDVVADAHP